MVHWVHGTLGTWYIGYMLHWVHGTLGTWYIGYMVHWVHGTLGTSSVQLGTESTGGHGV